jgi:hypothetical protein
LAAGHGGDIAEVDQGGVGLVTVTHGSVLSG